MESVTYNIVLSTPHGKVTVLGCDAMPRHGEVVKVRGTSIRGRFEGGERCDRYAMLRKYPVGQVVDLA